MANVIVPTINKNGTSHRKLMDAHRSAHEALDFAITAMHGICPHGRDFPFPRNGEPASDVLRGALAMHRTRIQVLEELKGELEELMTGIDNQDNNDNCLSLTARYAYVFCDIVQVNRDDGRGWLDFSTIKEASEAPLAMRIVDTDGACSGFSKAQYRIVDELKRTVKYSKGGS